jgi:ribonuclease D
LINTTDTLADFLPKLDATDPVALDTEADSLHCYFEKLCLIQISTPGDDVLVDPLAGVSLAPLFQLLAQKQLVLHGADYDLRLLRRAGFTEQPRSVFDTMIAARLTGHVEFSLAALVSKHFGVELVKGSQKANWAQRPLSRVMEEYAKNDTRYLLPLVEKLSTELHSLNRWAWFQQSCERAVAAAQIDRERDWENAWRINGSSDLQDRAASVLRALWRWRDEEARAVDRPPFHILQNDKLIEAAQRLDSGDPVNVPFLPAPRRKRFFAAAEAALSEPSEAWPKLVRKPRLRPTPEQERLFSRLKARRDAAATALKLEPSLIAPKSVLESLAADPESASVKLLPWQREILAPIS